MQERVDVAVVGAGAAGLFAALAARGALRGDGHFEPAADGPSVALLDARDPPGRKILISGGGRCNVTNAIVTEADFRTESPNVVRAALRELPSKAVRRFFEERGVALAEEPIGKVFPEHGRAKDVLRALLDAARACGVTPRFGAPVTRIARAGDGWEVDGLLARRVVVATGGLSVPETGSTGFGYEVARAAGHTLVPPVPALVPLVGSAGHGLAGVTLPAILSVVDAAGREEARAGGSMLFTHHGVSGPAALDVSGAFERARADGREVRVLADLWTLASRAGPFARYLEQPKPPGSCLHDPPRPTPPEELDRTLQDAAERGPRRRLGAFLTQRLPRSVVEALVPAAPKQFAQITREERRAAARAVTALDLGVTGTEGFRKAEVTAGGVPLAELVRRTLESRLAPGLHFCGEVCDVTGRLGGFNFQWAWSSGWLAGRGAAAGLAAGLAAG